MSNKAEMMEVIGAKMEADARVHIKNIMMICDNPVGIGEHGDIVETVIGELEKLEKLESLKDLTDRLHDHWSTES